MALRSVDPSKYQSQVDSASVNSSMPQEQGPVIGNPMSMMNMDPRLQPIMKALSPILNSKQGLELGSKMGGITRKASDMLRNTPGAYALPQVGADIFELARNGTPGENPFRSEEQNLATRNIKEPAAVARDVGKEAASIASMAYVPELANSALASTGAFQGMQASHPFWEYALRQGLTGTAQGTAMGLGSEKVSPTSVASSAAAMTFLRPIMGLLSKGLTTKQLGQTMDKAAQKSTQQGNVDNLRDIENEAKAIMKEKMGADYTLHKKEADAIMHKLITERGDPLVNPTKLTPSDMLSWKSQLSPKASGNFIQQLLGSITKPNAGIENQVAEALRSTLSARITDVTPEMGLLNTLYGAYKSPLLGSPAAMAGKGAAAVAGVPLIKSLLGGL